MISPLMVWFWIGRRNNSTGFCAPCPVMAFSDLLSRQSGSWRPDYRLPRRWTASDRRANVQTCRGGQRTSMVRDPMVCCAGDYESLFFPNELGANFKFSESQTG